MFLSVTVFGEEITLKWGSIEAMGGLQYQVMQWVIPEVEARSNGRLKIDYYPANQLGSSNEQVDGVIAGTIDVLPLGCNLMGNLGKYWIIDSLPFVFKDKEHRIRYNNSEYNKDRHKDLLKEQGLVVIGYNWYRTPHVTQSSKPILKPEDFSGFKMRVGEARGQYIGWKEVGTNPVTVPWGEVYLALKQGVADGVFIPFEMIPEQKFYEVVKYVIMLESEWSYENIMMNEATYKKLEEEGLEEILITVIKEGGDKYTELSNQNYDVSLEFLKEKGIEILFVDDSLFIEKLKGLPEKLDKEGLLDKEMFEKVENL